jgi:GH15 family glucan-1,4-alpha-glucosidase
MLSLSGVREIGYNPIENYGIIGNFQTVALVGLDGSIDFMCFPNFDSPSVFAALLDSKKGGYFKITSTSRDVRCKQLYITNTNVLLTRFLSASGVGEILDCMPISNKENHEAIIRMVQSVRGENQFILCCAPKFNYGRSDHQVLKSEDGVIFISNGPDKQAFRLVIDVPYEIKNGAAFSKFKLRAGESKIFAFEEINYETKNSSLKRHNLSKETIEQTEFFWKSWINRSTYKGRWREMVDRSALLLKLLTSATYGSIIAAPTFGLPESIGGARNWDYRYTWIRDASFSLHALIQLGLIEEASAFMGWLENRCHECDAEGSLQVMYGIDGRRELPESTLSHFEGYMRSTPVRVGNGAADQLQLDIYGELMGSVYLYNQSGASISNQLWSSLTKMIQWVVNNWKKPDESIWEVRGGRKEFFYSRMMCWVAMDRAIRLSMERSFPAPIGDWLKVRDEIYQNIYANFWSKKQNTFVQYKKGETLDAATLMAPLVNFISPTDPQWLSTLAALEKELVSDSLVYRYNTTTAASDGLVGNEGTFSMCSFWYAEVLARSGRLDEAQFYFEKMLTYANHLGLYSEELGPKGEFLGNFPQAFTHLALIKAACTIDNLLNQKEKK